MASATCPCLGPLVSALDIPPLARIIANYVHYLDAEAYTRTLEGIELYVVQPVPGVRHEGPGHAEIKSRLAAASRPYVSAMVYTPNHWINYGCLGSPSIDVKIEASDGHRSDTSWTTLDHSIVPFRRATTDADRQGLHLLMRRAPAIKDYFATMPQMIEPVMEIVQWLDGKIHEWRVNHGLWSEFHGCRVDKWLTPKDPYSWNLPDDAAWDEVDQ